MKAALVALSGLLVMPPVDRPPLAYQGESQPAIVLFASPAVVNAVCSRTARLKPGHIALACTNPAAGVILMPDPCLFQDGYATLMCHERGHLRREDGSPGWDHG